jgi:regulatory protein
MPHPENPADRAAIRARAIKLLARREHALSELVRKLTQRGFDADAAASVAAELKAENLLSEARFAESVARSRTERGYGPLRIRAELSAKGVDEGAIDHALASQETDWGALAERVRRKRFGAALPRDFPTKARQMRFLQQRGFDADAIRRALEEDNPP